jgi:hypothetical protein
MGLRSIDLQNNRGDGGQNEIGPELFRDMAILRTAELLSAHRIDGAEQYFTRAIDFGYSFDPQEVIQKWGREDIVGDYVRLLRTLRPDVVLTMNIQGRGGDRAHEATAVLFREAYYAAGDPSKYPAQLRERLRPWQPKKLYFAAPAGGGGRGGPTPQAAPPVKLAPANTNAYDALLGRTYAEIGSDARSQHKCQGTGGLPALPGINNGRGGGGGGGYQLIYSTIPGQKDKTETSLFDGVDTRLEAIAQYAGPNPPAALISGLGAIAADAKAARNAFDSGNDDATAQPAEAGLAAIRTLRAHLAGMGLNDAARYEVDFRLGIKERDYEDAVLAAHGLSFDAIADDGLVIAGQPVKLSILAMNRGPSDVSVTGVSIAARPQEGCGLHLRFRRPRSEKRPADNAILQRQLLEAPAEPGDSDLRRGCGVRRSLRAHAVPRNVPRQSGRCRGDSRGAGGIPIREGHLPWRQAHGAQRRSGFLGKRHAGPRHHPGFRRRRIGAGQARDSRLCYQWDEGRCGGLGISRSARRLEGDAGERAAQLFPRG